VFLSEAAWMFIYTISIENGKPVLKVYDRDYGTCSLVEDIEEVFNTWWKIVEWDA
jgi:hypothetical protein